MSASDTLNGRFAASSRPRVPRRRHDDRRESPTSISSRTCWAGSHRRDATLRDYLGRGCTIARSDGGSLADPAFVEAGYFAPGTYRDCVIVGEWATLAADFGTSEVRVHANQHVKGAGGWQAPEGPVEAVKASGKEPLSHELELFLDAVAHRTAPAVDVEAGLLALGVVEAAQRSSALGRRVTLSEIG